MAVPQMQDAQINLSHLTHLVLCLCAPSRLRGDIIISLDIVRNPGAILNTFLQPDTSQLSLVSFQLRCFVHTLVTSHMDPVKGCNLFPSLVSPSWFNFYSEPQGN